MKRYIFLGITLILIDNFVFTMELHSFEIDRVEGQLAEDEGARYLSQLKLDPFARVLLEFKEQHQKYCTIQSKKENYIKVYQMLGDTKVPQSPPYIQEFLNRYQEVINFTQSDNPRFDKFGNTAFHLLVQTQKLRLIKEVLENFPKSNFFIENYQHETAYAIAQKNHPKIKSVFDKSLIPTYIKGRFEQLRNFDFDSFSYMNCIRLFKTAFIAASNEDHPSRHQLRNSLGHAIIGFLESRHAHNLDLSKPFITINENKISFIEYAGKVNSIVGFEFLMENCQVTITDKIFERLYEVHKNKKSKILRLIANQSEDKLQLNKQNRNLLAAFKKRNKRLVEEIEKTIKKPKYS